ncbi:DNA helicase UvrD [Candidatus Roizmanbacteria bacterium]|nr:DNA helicase UvrD [Candidatus Roizmanbacteria bacterium]
MQIIADLQLHSKYSRAVSQKMDLEEIARWSAKKGIQLVATGDWTHPLWFREIKTKLKEISPGIYSLNQDKTDLPTSDNVRFLLSTEISSIYTQGGKVRRVHNLIFSPSIETCEKIIKELQRRGANLMSDGRPIVGISSKDLLAMVLNVDSNVLFICAHVWTPWFSLYGSKSGFDSIEECFGELSKNIYAIETGLSSDPLMNWQIKELENRSILSFSDAHSGPKLGREATVFTCNMKHVTCNITYLDIANAIKQIPNSHLKIGYTIEFFPEEGKYHWSGHRVCNIRYNPQEIKEKGTTCPVCHQPLTIGVENRVMDLSSKSLTNDDLLYTKNETGVSFVYDKDKKRRPFVSLIPLLEILIETNNGSQIKALREYERLTSTFAPEFEILLKKSYEEIEKNAGSEVKKAIEIVRERKVFVDPGYDGVFGKVKIFKDEKSESEEKKSESQPSLF